MMTQAFPQNFSLRLSVRPCFDGKGITTAFEPRCERETAP